MRLALVICAALLLAGCDEAAPAGSGDGGTPPIAPPVAGDDPAPSAPGTRAPGPPGSGGRASIVASVTDGDTIRLRGGARVRLVQIDTPEVNGGAECGGRAASAALASQLPPGTRVRLVPEPAGDAVDRYGRLLRYVYRGDRNLNVWMVRQGHAAPYFFDGIRGRFAGQLDQAVREARSARRGFWGHCSNAVLDAYRGLETGQLAASSGVSDAARGAASLGAGAGLPVQPASGPDVDCGQLPRPVRVTPGDPHRLDADDDGIGCD